MISSMPIVSLRSSTQKLNGPPVNRPPLGVDLVTVIELDKAWQPNMLLMLPPTESPCKLPAELKCQIIQTPTPATSKSTFEK